MKSWKEFDMSNVNYTTSKTRGKYGLEYINLEAAFDIETTSTVVDGQKTAFMYVWMLGIGANEDVYYGRTWQELNSLLDKITECFDLNNDRRLIVYSHNLSFEFQFMRKYIEWASSFNLKERKPLRATTIGGIEFRDSYILSGYSLEDTAKQLTNSSLEKLDGYLDYDLIRHHETELTEEELAYCKADIQILTAYIKEEIGVYGSSGAVPLTNTARVRKYVYDETHFTHEDHSKSCRVKYNKYRRLMEELTIEEKEYMLLKKAFQGGFVHANALWTGYEMENATGIDLASAYPAVMLSERFPMGKGEEITINSMKELKDTMKLYNMLFTVRFTGLKSIIDQENYISESKCDVLDNPLVNNGRVKSADVLETTITEVDFQIIEQAYEWESMQLANVIRYPSGFLPKDLILAVLKLYEDKTELKDVKGKEKQYVHSKGMLNSTFGMMVSDIVRAEISYKNGWKTKSPLVKEELKAYNERKKRFTSYPWGVWITAYARKNLWSGILQFGDDYLYSDTDGIKLINYEDHVGYIDAYNDLNKRKLELMCDIYRINPKRLSPLTKEGVPVLLGAWEIDGEFDRFKTLGAKRYLVQKGDDVELTVAGVGKRSAKDYLLEECDGNIDKVFEMFDDEMNIPKEYSGNLTHSYIDEKMEFELEDYLGKVAAVKVESGIHLEAVDFSLSLSSTYITFIEMLKEGFIFEGIDTFNV